MDNVFCYGNVKMLTFAKFREAWMLKMNKKYGFRQFSGYGPATINAAFRNDGIELKINRLWNLQPNSWQKF